MKKGVFLVLLSLAVIPLAAWPQEVTGNLEGYVLDSEGVPIGDAKVIISGPSLQGTKEAATDERGHFLALLLPVGTYTLKIAHPVYQEANLQNVSIRLGRTTALGEIRLKLRSLEAHEIVVSAERPVIDPSSVSGGINVGAQAIEALPVDRNYRNISLLLPNANPSFLGDEGVNFSGATGIENKYFIDGIEVTNPTTGYGGINLPFNFVKEFEIRTGGYEAEYRSSLGGIVNVITYSGGNEFSGQVFGYYANNRYAGEPRLGELPSSKGDYSQYDFGLSLGGPILRDKLWFFIAYDPTFQREDFMVPGLGFYPDKATTHIFAGKLTWQASRRTSVVFTTLGDPTYRDAVGDFMVYKTLPKSVLNPDPYLGRIEKGGTSFSLKGTHVFNDNFLVEADLSQLSTKDSYQAATERGQNESVFVDAEGGTVGGGYSPSAEYLSKEWTLSLKGTLKLADHIIKSGLEYRENKFTLDWASHDLTRYSDSFFEDVFVLIKGTVLNRIPSLFIQDSWGLSRRLQLNIGLRWDGQIFVATNGKVAQKILGQYQPRIGVIYELGTLGTQKLFGSYGRFYQELSLFMPVQCYNEQLIWGFTDYDHDPRVDPSGGETFQVIPGIQPENEGFEGQCFDEFSIGYERLLGRDFKIGVRGIYRTLHQGAEDALDQETGQYYWGNPGLGRLSNYPRMSRDYAALELTAERPAGRRFNFYASYVFSRNYGNYPGLYKLGWGLAPNGTNQFDYPELLINGTGVLPNDRPHVFKFFGAYRWPFGVTVGTSILWQSGTPLSELGGSRFGGMWNEFISQRGTAGRTPSIFDLNFRLVYDLRGIMKTRWKPKIVLDVFHLGSSRTPVSFDQVHYFGLDENGNQTAHNPNYGQVTRYFPAASVRLGFEVVF